MKKAIYRTKASRALVEIRHPNIDVELAYATECNFTGMKLYMESQAFLNEHAAMTLYRAADLAAAARLRIRLYDAFRPSSVQEKLWEIRPDHHYVADPKVGSDHTRGIAVDVTLCDRHGACLDMGTNFDEASEKSHHGPVGIAYQALRNRLILAGIMTVAGFIINPLEWWHYSLPHSEAYPLL